MKRTTGVPLRPLVVLALLVLAAHGLVLRGAPDALSWRRPAPPLTTLVTRSVPQLPVEVAAPAGYAPPAPVRPAPAAAPRPRPRATPATPQPQAVPPAQVPAPALWRYAATASRRGVLLAGQAQLHWRHDGSRYEAALRIDVPPLPAREQRSEGAVTPQGLAPQRFAERTRSEEATHFEREQGRIVFSSNRPPVPLQAGAQDRLSVLLQVAAALAADPARFVPGAQLAMQTAGTREADAWRLDVEGTEALDLPGGPVHEAVKFTRLPAREYDVKLEAWFAPGAAYAPVRLRLTAPNGDWLDLQWSGTDKG